MNANNIKIFRKIWLTIEKIIINCRKTKMIQNKSLILKVLYWSFILYGAPFRQKLVTVMHTNYSFWMTSKYFSCTINYFNQYNICLYTTSRNILDVTYCWFFLLPQHISCDSHNFGVQLKFYVKYFCVDRTIFCATRT